MSILLGILTISFFLLAFMLIGAALCVTFLKVSSHKKYQKWLEHLKEKHKLEFNESEDEE